MKNIIVTGASKGVGLNITEELMKNNYFYFGKLNRFNKNVDN